MIDTPISPHPVLSAGILLYFGSDLGSPPVLVVYQDIKRVIGRIHVYSNQVSITNCIGRESTPDLFDRNNLKA